VATKIKLLTVQNRRLEASRNWEIKDLGDGFDGIFNEIKKEGSRNRAVLRQLSLAAEKGLGYASEQALLDFIRFDTSRIDKLRFEKLITRRSHGFSAVQHQRALRVM
jgi:hypothetical protein